MFCPFSTDVIPIQINGKRKDEISVAQDVSEETIKKLILKKEIVKKALLKSSLKRLIYVPKRIVNLVIK